jgi:endonuclease G, mitochondrial
MASPPNEYAFDYDAMSQAADNWRRRKEERERKTRAVRNRRYDEAEPKERLAKWVNRRLRQVKAALPAGPLTLPNELRDMLSHETFRPDEIDNDLMERVIGATRDFLAVAFLERAVRATRCVGRIETRLGGGRRGYGTGALVSSRLLLTNHHVLRTAEHAANSVVEFDYQLDALGQPLTVQRFDLDPQAFFLNDPRLDFALVAVASASAQRQLLADYGWSPLIREEGKIRLGDCVNVVQHPRGEMKQVVIRENKLLDLLETVAHYEADTEPGSSGSPVFNDEWEMVALHHSGVPKMDDAKQHFLDIDGNVWKKGDDPLRLAWVANEGIRISRLVDFVAKVAVRSHEEPLRTELLAGREPAATQHRAPRPSPHTQPSRNGGTAVDEPLPTASTRLAAGAVSITIPLHVTVSLGEPVQVRGRGTEADAEPETGALEAITPDPQYERRPGYDPNFLGFPVPLPKLTSATRPKAVEVEDATGPNKHELKYHHFSIIMNGERRLAFVAAVNYHATARFTHARKNDRDRWFFDPRMNDEVQAGNEFYADNPLDRGHLVRRADAAWGTTRAEAKRANDDTFHFTNCSPQHEIFNQATKANGHGLLLWGNIEEHVAKQGRENNRRLCVFNGPVFRGNDRKHRGLRIPKEFWKVVVLENDAGKPTALAFVLSQHGLIRDLPPEEFEVGPYFPFQVKVRKIEDLTKLDLGELRQHDPLEDVANEAAFEAGTDFVPLDRLEDIVL